jgi:hypothetical protein
MANVPKDLTRFSSQSVQRFSHRPLFANGEGTPRYPAVRVPIWASSLSNLLVWP